MPNHTILYVGINGIELSLRFDTEDDAAAFIANANINPAPYFTVCWDREGRRVYVRLSEIAYIRPRSQR